MDPDLLEEGVSCVRQITCCSHNPPIAPNYRGHKPMLENGLVIALNIVSTNIDGIVLIVMKVATKMLTLRAILGSYTRRYIWPKPPKTLDTIE